MTLDWPLWLVAVIYFKDKLSIGTGDITEFYASTDGGCSDEEAIAGVYKKVDIKIKENK